MARYSIADTTLTALGDAVRSQTGETRKEAVPILHTYTKTLASKKKTPVEVNIIECAQMKFKLVNGSNLDKITGGHFYGRNSSIVNFTFDENYETFINYDDISKAYTYFTLNIANTSEESCEVTIEASGIDVNGNVITELVEVPNVLTPLQMAEKINNLPPAIPESAFTISGRCDYRFSYNGWNWFIKSYSDKIITQNLTGLDHAFNASSDLKEIPFELNMAPSNMLTLSYAFSNCSELEAIPKINNLKVGALDNLFSQCTKLKSFPEGFAENWDWSGINSSTSGYSYNANGMFTHCYKIRSIPAGLLGQNKYNPVIYNGYSFYNRGFFNCYSLEEVTNVPVHNKATWTSNGMDNFVANCYRLKKLTFATQEDGSPFVVSWKSQILNLATTGFCPNGSSTTFKSLTGFTDDTKISSLEDWQNYRNGTNPDAWSYNVNHSVFGITAATELINSLPDTSAYLATAGGTNTLRFDSLAAMEVPGERLGELPEEVIAVAAAKGWTVSF